VGSKMESAKVQLLSMIRFDFAGTTEKDQIEAINGGLKMSADKSAASLMQGKVTGFKLAIVVLRY